MAYNKDDITTSLSHYEYPLIFPKSNSNGLILPIEDLTTQLLQSSTEMREVVSIIYLLGKFPLNPEKLRDLAIERNVVSKTGYMCDKTFELKNYSDKNKNILDHIVVDLKQYKGETWEVIPKDFPEEMIQLRSSKTALEKVWKIHDFLDYNIIKTFINK